MKTPYYLEVIAEPRYWEDCILNGKEDIDGNIPLRDGDVWQPIIELSTGKVQDWPKGVVAQTDYKVCDAGNYWLLDENKVRVAKWSGAYVPVSFLCISEFKSADYITLSIDENGIISNWVNAPIEDRWASLEE